MPTAAEVAELDQRLQIGFETTPGTAVAATKILVDATKFEATPALDVDTEQRGIGQKFPVPAIVGKELATIAVEGPLTYDSFSYWLDLALKTGAIASGGDATTRYHTWDLSQTAAETYSAGTFEHGSSIRARQYAGCQMSDLGIHFDLEANVAQFDGTLIGYPLSDGVTLTGSLSPVAATPMAAGSVDVYLDTTYSGIGGTKTTRCLKFDFAMSGHWSQFYPLNSANSRHAAGTVEAPPVCTVKMLVEVNSAGSAILTAARAGSSQFVKVLCTGPVAGSSTQNFYMLLPLKIGPIGPIGPSQGLECYEVTGRVVYDVTGGKNLTVRLENLLTAM